MVCVDDVTTVNYNSSKVVNVDNNNYQAKFEILDKTAEYLSIIFIKEGGDTFSAFDDLNPNYTTSGNANKENERSKCRWSSWAKVVPIETKCKTDS